jgi:hypothetical protein
VLFAVEHMVVGAAAKSIRRTSPEASG